MAIAEVSGGLPSARRIGRAEDALTDVAIRLPERYDDLRAKLRISTPEASFKVLINEYGSEVVSDDGRPVDVSMQGETDVWRDLATGVTNGLEAVHHGRITVRGNVHLAMDLGSRIISDQPHRWHYEVGRPRVGRLRIARLRTHLRDSGEIQTASNPVLVMHGLSATKSSMLPTIVGLAASREVHAIDHPGHGDSDKPFVSYTPSFLAGTAIRYIDQIGAERVDLIGNSLGGRVALEIAARRPDRVGRMVLYAPAMAPARDRGLIQLLKVVPSSVGMIPGIFTRGRAETVIRTLLGGLDGARQSLIDAAVDDFLRIYSSASARRALYSSLRGYLLADSFGEGGFWTSLPEIEAPALFIWGRHDPLVSWRYYRLTAQWLPHAVSAIYEDGGHVPQIEHPDRTHEITRDFLDGGRPEASTAVSVWG